DFVRVIHLQIPPPSGVLDQLSDVDSNRVLVDADVLVGSPDLPAPLPDLAEHPPVQGIQELLGKNICPAPTRDGTAHRPLLTHPDVCLLQLVQLRAGRNMSLQQPLRL